MLVEVAVRFVHLREDGVVGTVRRRRRRRARNEGRRADMRRRDKLRVLSLEVSKGIK